MAKIVISAHEVLYNGTTPYYARIFCNRTFVNDDGQTVQAGSIKSNNYLVQAVVSVSGNVVTIPSLTGANRLDSTIVESTGRVLSTYTVTLHTRSGAYLTTVESLQNIKIPPSPTTTTWDDLAVLATAITIPYRAEYYNREEIDRLLSGLSIAPLASDVIEGKTALDFQPASLSDPIAVGANSPRIAKNLYQDYGNSLATAITSISSTETVLEITRPVTVGANTTLPANIALDIKGTGLVTISSGFTLTVGNLIDAGNRQIFAGDGTVRYANGSVNHINTAWRAGNGANVNLTDALNEAIASAAFAGGICRIYIPQIAPLTDGLHDLGSSVIIYGNGNYSTGSNGYGTSLRLSKNVDYMFKVDEQKYSVRWENITLDANGFTGDGVLFEGTGGANTSSGDFSFTNVTFDSFTRGVVHNSLGSSWQLAQLGFYNCIFQACTTGFRSNSVNAQVTMINTNFAVPASGVGMDLASAGLVTLIGSEFAGAGATSKGIVISGSHGGLNLIGYQDENLGTSIQNDASDISGIINIGEGSLIQGKIQVNETCIINITKSNLMSYALQGAPSGGYASVKDCYIREVSVNDGVTVVSPAVLSSMTGGMVVVSEELSTLNKHVKRIPQRFIAPLSALGSPSTPVQSLGHITNGTDEDKILLRLGRMTTAEIFDFYYDIYRDHSSGYLHFSGNQADPNKAFSFNAPLIIPDEAYDAATWNANLQVPTKNAVRDEMELKAPKASPTFTGTVTGAAANLSGALTALSIAVGSGTVVTKIVKGAVTIDPASVNATTFSSQTFTLTGAVAGDSLTLNPPTAGLTTGMMVAQSFVSATDQITICFYNTTGAPIDLASASWTYTLIRS